MLESTQRRVRREFLLTKDHFWVTISHGWIFSNTTRNGASCYNFGGANDERKDGWKDGNSAKRREIGL
jgi:hypothetical protein